MDRKLKDPDFRGDMNGLVRTGIDYDIDEAYAFVKFNILERL